MKNLFLATVLAFGIGSAAQAQNVAINTDGSAAATSAILDVKSTTQGMLVPRMTQAQRNLIGTPATGLLVYQTDETAGFYFHNGSAWVSLNTTTDAAALTSGTLLPARMPALSGDVNSTINTTTTTIANDAVTSAKILNSTIATADIADNAVTVAKLPTGATGTTFLRGDGTWATAGGGTYTSTLTNTVNVALGTTTSDISTTAFSVGTDKTAIISITVSSTDAVTGRQFFITDDSNTILGSSFTTGASMGKTMTVVAIVNNSTASAANYKLRGVAITSGVITVTNFAVRKMEF